MALAGGCGDQVYAAFRQPVLDVLTAHHAGLTELALLHALADSGEFGFDRTSLRDQLGLFRAHFILFHTLYRLRDELLPLGERTLRINALNIALIPCEPGTSQQLAQRDALRSYYLDLNNLHATDADDVAAMLGRFWIRMNAGEDRKQALAALELAEPVTLVDIKRQYRALVMQHHPDRGGDHQRLQRINDAMATLNRYFT